MDIPCSFNNSDDKHKKISNGDIDILTVEKESFNFEVLTNQLSQSLTDDKGGSDDPINIRDTFKMSLYIDGSEASGLVTMQFKKVTNNKSHKASWVPVELLVETHPNSGVNICHISSPPPNGLTRFRKLFVDQQ